MMSMQFLQEIGSGPAWANNFILPDEQHEFLEGLFDIDL